MQTPTYQAMDLAAELRLPTNGLDYTILAIYFAVVLGIGFAARRSVKTSLDFFLSGRSLPAWMPKDCGYLRSVRRRYPRAHRVCAFHCRRGTASTISIDCKPPSFTRETAREFGAFAICYRH